MSVLLDGSRVEARRAAAAGGLAPLARSLAADLRPSLSGDPFVPTEKARMSRAGGRCPRDGAALEFDPSSPHAHRCPGCDRVYAEEAHYRSWIMWYQLWLAERAVHAAALHLVVGEPGCAAFADRVLDRYVELYLRYPNRDNVLGPTRPFFSTYLESIWLLQVAVALDLRELSGDLAPALGSAARERVIAPSADLIASYDEGGSNRQVWNAAALAASARLLDDAPRLARALEGPSGIASQLADGLLADGTWYEGDNYHQFAHRGLWYGVAIADAAGVELPAALRARFAAGFAAPFVSALPDFTFPSRRDSQYGVSLRQWRFAEMAELGLAERDDRRLLGALHELYRPAVPRGDTGRARSAAESERNIAPAALTRADLGWRSLLFARETLPELSPFPAGSVLLEGQGLAILRRESGTVYAALDYGVSGGGHGHPDRLNVLLVRGATRWLDDPGTGSYVDPSLHWYRSTLAHDAPLVDGRSQQRVDGVLRAYDERGGAGWVDAEARIAPGVVARRAVVAMGDYVVDELTWRADRDVVLDLPLHADGDLFGAGAWGAASLEGGDGAEDGFEFLTKIERADGSAEQVRLAACDRGERADVWVTASPAAEWWRARAPGPPGRGERRFHLARQRGRAGRLVSVWSWREGVAGVATERGRLVVESRDGGRHEHRRVGEGWRVGLWAGGASSSIDLAGARPASESAPEAPASDRDAAPPIAIGARGAHFELGEAHYRRSEESFEEAGSPTAQVDVAAARDHLLVSVSVARSERLFVATGAVNEMDNEHPDVNGDGIQLYLVDGDRQFGWRLVPVADSSAVRVEEVRGAGGGPPVDAEWRRAGAGYLVECRIAAGRALLAGERSFGLDVIVNETAPGRERRRGQLVLSGGRGEFVYLRGDRHAAERALRFVIATDASRTDV